MKGSFDIGELVYIPSDVILFNESETCRLKKPLNLLITGRKDALYEVLYDGNAWYVENSSVYELREKNVKIY